MKLKNLLFVFCLALLAGCASQQSQQVLGEAEASFQQVKEDPNVLRSAPKDVIRAGESLARAERLSSYWGSADDVVHYAYLSQRYSQIARQHADLVPDEAAGVKTGGALSRHPREGEGPRRACAMIPGTQPPRTVDPPWTRSSSIS